MSETNRLDKAIDEAIAALLALAEERDKDAPRADVDDREREAREQLIEHYRKRFGDPPAGGGIAAVTD